MTDKIPELQAIILSDEPKVLEGGNICNAARKVVDMKPMDVVVVKCLSSSGPNPHEKISSSAIRTAISSPSQDLDIEYIHTYLLEWINAINEI
eukprot:CAMPEP_0116890688 /NCGR_PEP_ID=MMETSP0467-20121206/1210_1 /TAXON_ID=283647 /ORGANISM="Mesodinium pulex, Strain SPMC105" /LENGTH=92 /DNA_ID=CAMNT_0004558665 /DNA_START=295 /DNA_END=573 /DNA_ORIENTATION=-